MKIGIDITSASGRRTGTGNYTYQLVKHLLELDSGHEFILFCRRQRAQSNPLLALHHPRVRCVLLGGKMNFLYHQVYLPRALSQYHIDLYHSPGFFLPLAWNGPKVVTIHDLNIYRFPKNWWRPGSRTAYIDLLLATPLSIWLARKIITDCEFVKRDVSQTFLTPTSKIEVAYLGWSPLFELPPSSDELHGVQDIHQGAPFFLSVGILSPQKNLERLIQSFANCLARSQNPVKLVIVGKPDGGAYVERLKTLIAELHISDSVIFAGYVDETQLRALYHTTLALVVPYLGEGFGLPVLEAMKCGAPVITSPVSSIPEVGGDAVLYVNPESINELANAMQQMLCEPGLRTKYAQAGIERAKAFSWQQTARKTLDIYAFAYAKP
jgi:glycosyltransferase involved in cell wall biosynthesis